MASKGTGGHDGTGKEKYIIMGAAGRDFHVFNVLFRNNDKAEVVAFTATQIHGIDDKKYPPELSGPLYPEGIQIYPEAELQDLIKINGVNKCILAYSDISAEYVLDLASRVLVTGADFLMLAPYDTFLNSTKPVVAVTAVRTGAGKSQVSAYVNTVLHDHKLKTVLVRHPMPYGDLKAERVQRFATYEDLEKQHVTVEEREEYEQHLKKGTIVYAGVDYEAILREAEKEADVIIWDGGNNDTPFFKPDLWMCIADPHRVGHERTYYPGCVNFRAADVIIINKANTAEPENIEKLKKTARELNPGAKVIVTDSTVTVADADAIRGKKVVLVEDGPTLTHGGMPYGAGKYAAEANNAEIVDPREYYQGTLRRTLKKYSHIGKTIPATGYSPKEVEDLAKTINAVPADAVVVATPMDLNRLIHMSKPSTTVAYKIGDREGEESLRQALENFIQSCKALAQKVEE
ncbi:g659 [Coccomyxa viridis]|uniref:G659 protein n=1 Tax=Coccomyxa viridis TaxID=1274662 RepID=A0ABP1FG94_9CHLO